MKALTSLRAQASARWQTFSPRDQRVLAALASCLGVLLVAAIAVLPARNTLHDSDNRRAHIAQQQAHMLALQAQAQALKARTPLSRDEALRSLQSLTPGTQMQLNVQGDRVTVQLKAVPAPALANWLTQARSQAQALPVEAHLTRNTTGTASTTPPTTPVSNANVVVWDGNLVLSLPNRGATAN